jgi:hypothetical protein
MEHLAMTCTQKQAIWELCRLGLHQAATSAEQAWDNGRHFEPESQLPLTREIAVMIDCANWDARRKTASQRPQRAIHRSVHAVSAAA